MNNPSLTQVFEKFKDEVAQKTGVQYFQTLSALYKKFGARLDKKTFLKKIAEKLEELGGNVEEFDGEVFINLPNKKSAKILLKYLKSLNQ